MGRQLVGRGEGGAEALGDYRIIYAIDEGRIVICVVPVAHRGIVYRHTDRLPPGWD